MTVDERLDDLDRRVRHQSNLTDRILAVLEKLIMKSDHNFKALDKRTGDEEKNSGTVGEGT
jgi:hypothetical protein